MANASMTMPHAGGMMAIEKLINSAKPTHVAVKSGAWSNPSTWQGGRIPGDGATVLIDKGKTVTYDALSEERLKLVAIRGELKVATGTDTKLVVETILNAPEGKFNIGSAQQAVRADKQAEIVFTSDRAVDRQRDPSQLTKGFVSHGEVNIYGAAKNTKVRLAKDAVAGDNVLTFKDNLSGWRVGDEIVLAGTGYRYKGDDKTNERFQDEVLKITEINGNQVKFVNTDITSGDDTVLRFDHVRHAKVDPGKIDLYAANLSRNVSFATENGKRVPISHRAHVMLMHNPNVTVMNAGFYDLGRSDKSKIVDDVGKNVDGSNGNGNNIRGRYALHLHQTGLDPNKTILLKGNAISGSPGWGIVQHESRAGLEDNVVFDTVGAGIAAESGNETGWWTNNISIKSTGVTWQVASQQKDNRERKFDLGFRGDGFWVQGAALIANKDNVAISNNHTGMSLFSGSLELDDFRPIETIPVSSLPADVQKLFAPGQTEVDIRLVPMATVKGFEGYNNNKGLDIWGHSTNFDGELAFSEDKGEDEIRTAHEGRSRFEDFKLWNNRWDGLSVQYSSNIDVQNGLVIGTEDDKGRKSGGRGVFVNHATFNSKIDRLTVDGFEEGAHFEKLNTDKNFNTNTLENSNIKNNTYNLSKVANEVLDNNRQDDFGAFVKMRNNQFDIKTGNRAPAARFTHKGIGGLSVELDASTSSDPDPYVAKDGSPKPVESKGIAGYLWDVDNNGTADYFGRTLKHTFARAGNQKVALTVVDSQGATNTVEKTVNVQPTAYGNAFLGGDFGSGAPVQDYSWKDNSEWADKGWFVSPYGQVSGGVAKLSQVGKWTNHIGQVVRNEKIHKGAQTLSFKLQNKEGSTERETWRNNGITVKLWGVNGQFENTGWEPTGPTSVGTLPMQRTELVSQEYGGENGEFFDWRNISLDANLGQGYDYLLFQVNTTASLDAGDSIAIDDVSLTGRANSTPPTNPDPDPPTDPNPPSDPDPDPPTNPNPPNPQKPFSIAQLSFDEGQGPRALDISPAGLDHHGRLRNNADWSTGKKGQAVKFDGEMATVTLRNSEELTRGIHGDRTVSLWFKADNPGADKAQILYEEGNSSRGMNLYLNDGLVNFGGWNRPESKWEGDWGSGGQVKAGSWNHVALVLDGDDTVKNNALTAYLNGRQIGQVQGSQLWKRGTVSLGNTTGTTRFEDGIGMHRDSGFAGSIDELEVFNSAMSANEVKALMG